MKYFVLFWFAPRSASQAAQTTRRVIRGMVPTMAPGRITVEARWVAVEIGLIIQVPAIGTAAHITFGNRGTGHGDTANRFGSVVITSHGDIDPQVW